MTYAEALKSQEMREDKVFVFVGDQQTQGYGVASGSKWVSPLGNLYFTISMKVKKESVVKNALHYPQVTALAVVQTLESFGVDK